MPLPTLAKPLHWCDVTMFYAAHSGGVRTYIEAKHAWLSRRTTIRHSVVAPAGAAGPLAPYQRALAGWTLPLPGGWRFPLSMRNWTEALDELAPDLIEAGDAGRLGWAVVAAGQRLGVPATGFYHSDLPSLVGSRCGGWAAALARRYVRQLYGQFDLVLAPSRAMQRKLQALGVVRTRVQPLGVDAERFHPRRRNARLRRELGIGGAARLLVFAGRNAREKHVDRLVEAVRRLGSGYHLLLAGPRMPRALPGNASSLSRFVSTRELACLLASSDALVHAGDAETFGLIVLEAMACGIPVVGVDAGAVPEIVTPATGTLARSAAPAHLAEAIADLFERDARAMGRQARAAVEARWTWERACSGLLGTYAGLLDRRGADLREDLIVAAE